jgi:hypothetical protein
MAVADVSAAHQNAVGPHLEGLENKVRGDPARTHDPDHPNVRRVLQSTDPGEVSPGIGAPVAAESDNLGFKFTSHCDLSFAASFYLLQVIKENKSEIRSTKSETNPKS